MRTLCCLVGVLAALLLLSGVAIAEDGLVGYYPMDEGTGSVVHDQSGLGFDGTLYGGAQWVSGPFGMALSLNGTNAYVNCGVHEEQQIESAGTISVWICPTASKGGLVNWNAGGTAWNDERLVLSYRDNTSKIGFYMSNGTTYQVVREWDPPPLNVWTHIVTTFNGTTAKIYRDGQELYSVAQSLTPNLDNVPLWIGKSLGIGSNYFSGLIDEVRVYNRALSGTEVSDLYEVSGLVGFYPMGEDTGTVVHDQSGRGYNGTLNGGGQWVSGTYGRALSLNGTNAYVNCGVHAEQQVESAGTLSVWVRPVASQGGLVNWNSGGTNWTDERLVLSYRTTTSTLGFYMSNGTSYHTLRQWELPPLDEWTHIVVTFDGATAVIYRDGHAIYTVSQLLTPNLDDVPLWIGKSLGLGSSYFSGLIDEVRVYNRALSDLEVMALFKQDVPGRGKDTTYFDKVHIEAWPYPTLGRIFAKLDYLEMYPVPDGMTLEADLLDETDTVVATGVVTMLSAHGKAEADFTGLSLEAGTYTVRVIARDSEEEQFGEESLEEVVWTETPSASQGLVVYYPMDDGSGAIAHDESGNNIHGTVYGAQWATGDYGAALSFDGSNDYVDCTANVALRIESAGTIVFWVRPAVCQGGLTNWSSGTGWNDQRLVLAFRLGDLSFYMANGQTLSCLYSDSLPQSAWSQVAVTFDGEVARTYRDGTLVYMTSEKVRPSLQNIPLWIGKSQGLGEAFYSGLMNEVRVYNKALTDAEIFGLYKPLAEDYGKDTDGFTQVKVTAAAYPPLKRIVADLDYHEMYPFPEGMTIEADLLDVTDAVVATGVVTMLPGFGQAQADFTDLSLAAATYTVRVIVKDGEDEQVGQEARAQVVWTLPPAAFDTVRILNNLCWELLNVSPGSSPASSYSFSNPRDGWVYFRTEAQGSLTLSVAGATPTTIFNPAGGSSQEAMRFLPEGEYAVAVSGAGTLNTLIARSVATSIYCQYPRNPEVDDYGLYDWTFLGNYVLPSTNGIVCAVVPDRLTDWSGIGRRWHYMGYKIQATTSQQIYNYLTGLAGMTNSNMNGVILDEFGSTDDGSYTLWTEAFDDILSDEQYEGKMIIPYCGNLYRFQNGVDFIQKLIQYGSYFAVKEYLWEMGTEDDAWAVIRGSLGNKLPSWKAAIPDAVSHMIVCLAYLSQPSESGNVNPGTDFKVFMDMQFNHIATDPKFFGVGGLMEYVSAYADEENVRWTGALYHHYVIEGRTDRMDTDAYVLPHLLNPDFESGTTNWTIQAAETGSVAPKSYTGYSWLEGRYPATYRGDKFLWMKRSASGPNTFSQTITNLQPGRLYSMKMITGDYQDLVTGVSRSTQHGVTITLDNVDLLTSPDKSFSHIYPQNYSHNLGPFNVNYRYYMNYHWRVFRALGTTATVAVSDWSDASTPGGPTGQELMYNFIEIQPYFSGYVDVISPSTGLTYNAPVTLTAAVSNSVNTTSKVEFFEGATQIGSDLTTAPYTYSWSNPAVGNHTIVAKATDSDDAVGTSSEVSFTVNDVPVVTITAPSNGQTYSAPVTLTATVTNTIGTISKVQFFEGATQIGPDLTTAPYTYSWTAPAGGNHTITAKATDSHGAVGVSSEVSFTVN